MTRGPEAASGLLGILGGMGPLASAAFVRTLYRLAQPEREQEAPRAILLSDPSFPDRTAALERGEEALLADRLTGALETLVGAGAERIVIACFTVHAVLDRVAAPLRERVISLLDVAMDELALLPDQEGPLLLLATRGSRRAGLFIGHPRWPEVAHRVALLSEADQEALHERLYQLKAGQPPAGMVPWLGEVQGRYGAAGFVFGCTETHLLHEALCDKEGDEGWALVDPLLTIARGVSGATGTGME